MATTFSVTRNDIINAALRVVGVLGLTQTASATDITNATQALQLMLKNWAVKGTTLWKISELSVPLVADTRTYQIGPTATGTGAVVTDRPLKVLDQGNFIRNSDNEDTPITLLGRSDYEMYGSKLTTGIVNSIFYDPQLTNGVLSVYPTPSDSTRTLHLFVQTQYADMDSASSAPDFPQEWYAALKWGLARELVIEYGVDETTERRIERRYEECVPELLTASVDEGSAFFTYNNRGM